MTLFDLECNFKLSVLIVDKKLIISVIIISNNTRLFHFNSHVNDFLHVGILCRNKFSVKVEQTKITNCLDKKDSSTPKN